MEYEDIWGKKVPPLFSLDFNKEILVIEEPQIPSINHFTIEFWFMTESEGIHEILSIGNFKIFIEEGDIILL